MYKNYLKEIFDLEKIDIKLWFLLFLSFFIPFVFRLIPLDSKLNSVLLYGIIPILVIIFVFKEPIKDFGYSFGDKKKVVFYSLFFSALVIPIVALSYFIPAVINYYTIKSVFDINSFLLFELNIGFSLFFWELFFRGFVLFGLYKKLGNVALPIHAIPFALFHFGKPNIEIFASFFAALLLGQIALKSKSFLPAFVIHWVINAEIFLLLNLY
jgi:uncharacterized protein